MSELSEIIAAAEADEARLVFSVFSDDDAFRLGVLMRELAVARGHAITIDIARGEQRLFHTALPGTSAHNAKWIERKKATVREWQASSYAVGLRFPVLDPPYALEAALRMPPGVHVRVLSDRVLVSAAASVDEARHLWRLTLLNERLVAEADPARAELLMSLVA